MHLQQTKRGSRETGGPQYYFHDLSDSVKTYLRKKGAVRLALVTPYGATKSEYFAVSTDAKLDNKLRAVPGKVGHDRVQQGHASESIGEAIRVWYRLKAGDFERIDVDIEIQDDAFYLTPIRYKYADKPREVEIAQHDRPLTFTRAYASPLWIEQLVAVNQAEPGVVAWSLSEICRIMKDHRPPELPHVQEQDLLRASGPLRHLGLSLRGYVGKGYDCFSEFRFLDYPTYAVPVELKKNSRNFRYQERKYGKGELSRAVVLCAMHDHKTLKRHIDVIELDALCEYASKFPIAPSQ